eukprot:m.9885 g.9885  ORF g.9885 m.9885 type:complete len:322 (+) comp5502_c0_seq1:111-1076(+)
MAALKAISVWELDVNDDVIHTWSYPEVHTAVRSFVSDHIKAGEASMSMVGRLQDSFIYAKSSDQNPCEGIKQICVTLETEDYNPDKYLAFVDVALQKFAAKDCDGTIMLKVFLSAFMQGNVGKAWQADAFEAYVPPGLQDVVSRFKLMSLVIYMAVILKKRVLVTGTDTEQIVALCGAIPQLCDATPSWRTVYPLTTLEALETLSATPSFIAGCVDPDAALHQEWMDLIINADTNEVEIAAGSEAGFKMDKALKFIKQTLEELSNDEAATDASIQQLLTERTQGLMDGVRQVAAAKPERVKASIFLSQLAAAHDVNVPTTN